MDDPLYAVDQEALKRQKQMVAEGVNGRVESPRVPSISPSLARQDSTASNPMAGTPTNGLGIGGLTPKQEPMMSQSLSRQPEGTIAVQNGTVASTSMPPPSMTTPRPMSHSTPPEPVKLPWDSQLRSDRPPGYRKWFFSYLPYLTNTLRMALRDNQRGRNYEPSVTQQWSSRQEMAASTLGRTELQK